jgi:cytosine/adenosine deaminase-related metal-dependent hydrolase
MSHHLLIRNATVISVDEQIGTKENCDILIYDGVIQDIGQGLESASVEQIIDATNCIVSPGFVDTHHHLWQQLLRGLSTDWSLGNYIENIRNIYGSLFTPDDVYAANHFAALDLINNGITTVIDHCHILNSPEHTDAAIKALKDARIRGTWCYGLYQNPSRDDLDGSNHERATPSGFDREARMEDAKRAKDQHFPENDPEKQLLTFGAAPTEAEGMEPSDLLQEIDFFRSIGARIITMHVAMGNYDLNNQVVQHLGDRDYLGKDLLFSHGSSFTDTELDLIHKSGSGISSTPETELQMGMGHPVAFRAAAAVCNVGFGIDITSNQNNDMLALMRLMLQVERSKRHSEALGKEIPIDIKPKSEEALYMATLGGAKTIGLEHLIGSITPGKRADIIITRCDDMNVVPVIHPIGTLIYNANNGNIETVLVNGLVVKQKGQVLNVDWPKFREDIRQRTARILEVAGKYDLVTASSNLSWSERGVTLSQ